MDQTDHSPNGHGHKASSEALTVADINAMSDAQLIELIKKHVQPDNSISLPVDDIETLSEVELAQFSERLLSMQHAIAEDPSVNACPLDLVKLDSLLRDVASAQDSFARDRARTSQSVTPPFIVDMWREDTQAYDRLVNDGGRPMYSFDLIKTIAKDRSAYHDMLEPYARPPRGHIVSELDGFEQYQVLPRQLDRWRKFRRWQRDNRGIDDSAYFEQEVFKIFLEEGRPDWEPIWTGTPEEKIAHELESFKEPYGVWEVQQRHRNWQRKYQREPNCEGFSDYEKALAARLVRHGFTQPFRLAEDLKQQDKLTTWIEYLGFEYWWLDYYIASVERCAEKYRKACEEHTKSGLFTDDESVEYFRTDVGKYHFKAPLAKVSEVLMDAELKERALKEYFEKDPEGVKTSKEQRTEMVKEAEERVAAAREAADVVFQRYKQVCEFFRKTKYYGASKTILDCQKKLVKWVAEQVPVIEAEQKSAAALSGTRLPIEEKESVRDVCEVQPTPTTQKSDAKERSPQPSDDRIGTRDTRASRRQTRSSTDVAARDLDRQEVPGEHDMNPSQSAAQVQAQNPSTGAVADLETGRGSARKKRKATPEMDDDSVQSRPKRRAPNSPADRPQARASKPRAANTRASRQQVRATANTNQVDGHEAQRTHDTDPISQPLASDVPSRTTANANTGLRRSSRLAALAHKAEVPSRQNKSVSGGGGSARARARARAVAPASALGSDFVPAEKALDKRIRKRGRLV
ncbi:hypothetical protein E4U43_008314 [Claviceps pusilla]|uniref:Ankyrin 2,3/unc44 n=1 Tax=Claviceps pusilla TaxID=123648 RepID=A0A9P7T3M7_9HYPO|nr:hypothetical protein E4U43_008314 [Claviceps pusilla]